VKASLSESSSAVVKPLSADAVAGYTLLKDIFGNPILILRVDMPRDIYQQGQTTISYFIIFLLIAGLIFGGAMLLLLERIILSRLAALNAEVTSIRTSTNLSQRISVSGKDELSSLAQAINAMLESLAQAHDKLQTARDQALEALRLKAQILANVSHDARTPLNVITLHVELLQKKLYGPITPEQDRLLETVHASARQLLFFINNLLDEAQLGAGKVKLRNVNFRPADLLNDVQTSMTQFANRKGIQLKVEMSEDVPQSLCGDPDRLNQILFNLVNNAIKFTEQGTVQVRILKPDSGHWAMQVSDTGEGIPQDAVDRIFEAFWQVDGSSTRKVARGVGLGLSIVKQLSDIMGGTITVQSKVGSGSTFTVVLPNEMSEREPIHE
jgi:signal transduction histidine kinase